MAPLDVTLTAEVEQPDGSSAPLKLADLQQSDPAAGPGALEATQEAVKASVDALLAHLSAGGGTEVHGTVAVSNFPATYNVSDRPARQLGEVSVSNLPVVQEVEGTVDVAGVVDVGNFPADVDVRDRALRQLGHVTVDNQLDLTALATGARQDAQTALLTTLAAVDYATGSDIDQVVTRLDAIATNTADIKLDADHLSIEADAINLNTDGVEARLDTLNGKDFATQATLAAVLARANLLASEQTLAAVSAQLPAALSGDGGLLSHVTNFPAVVHVDDNAGSLTVDGPLTDAQLRAAAVPVSGPLTDAQLRAAAVPVDTEFAFATSGNLAAGANLLAAGNYVYAGGGNYAQVNAPSLTADATSLANATPVGNWLYNGSTWDRLRSYGSIAGAASNVGLLGAALLGWSGSAWGGMTYASGFADAGSGNGAVGVGNLVYNGSTWDRQRSIQSAGFAAVAGGPAGITGVGLVGYAGGGNYYLAGVNNANQLSVTASPTSTPPADAATQVQQSVAGYGFNATSWDRWRNNLDGTALASAARTATTSSADITNYNGDGALVILRVSTVPGTAPSLTVALEGKDPVSGLYYSLNATPTAVTAVGTYVYEVGEGASGAAGGGVTQRTAGQLPRVFRVTVTHGNANSVTYSVGYSVIAA